jgi:hypothetical protein
MTSGPGTRVPTSTASEGPLTNAGRPRRLHVYQTAAFDSSRWDGFEVRDGDIIVCTPIKSGTTWTQMVCALLVHQAPRFPEPLTRLSRWLDRDVEPIEDVLAAYEAQTHRRIIKTHTPLDGLPYFENAAYVFCGRDPRDVFLSMTDHMDNMSPDIVAELARKAGLPPDADVPTDRNQLFALWLTTGAHEWMRDGFPYGSVFDLTKTYWDFRHLPNVFFWHYADLMFDLDAEARRLAAFLDIAIVESRWPRLLQGASRAEMKRRADELAPGAHHGEWKTNADFFRMARLGQWREVLTAENQALYERVSQAIAPPPMKAWLEGGRRAAGDPKAIPDAC